jgi:hypothetical protein
LPWLLSLSLLLYLLSLVRQIHEHFASTHKIRPKNMFKEKSEKAHWWSGRILACISLAISLSQLLIIGGAIALVQMALVQTSPSPAPGERGAPIYRIAAVAWLIGGLGSVVFALTGLAFDSRRMTALAALIVAILTILICGTQMLV